MSFGGNGENDGILRASACSEWWWFAFLPVSPRFRAASGPVSASMPSLYGDSKLFWIPRIHCILLAVTLSKKIVQNLAHRDTCSLHVSYCASFYAKFLFALSRVTWCTAFRVSSCMFCSPLSSFFLFFFSSIENNAQDRCISHGDSNPHPVIHISFIHELIIDLFRGTYTHAQ